MDSEANLYFYYLLRWLLHTSRVQLARLTVRAGLFPLQASPTSIAITPGYRPSATPYSALGDKLRRVVLKVMYRVNSTVCYDQEPSRSLAPASANDAATPSHRPLTTFDKLLNPPAHVLAHDDAAIGAGCFDYDIRLNLGNLEAFKAEELRKYKFFGQGAGDPETGAVPRSWQLGEASLQVHGCGKDEVGRRLFQQVQQEVQRCGASQTTQQSKAGAASNTTSATHAATKQTAWGIACLGVYRLRAFRTFGKVHIFYFDEFALVTKLLNDSVLRSGVENHVANALFRGGLANLLPEEVRSTFIQSTRDLNKGIPYARHLCGNLAQLGLFGPVGYDNNNIILATHNAMTHISFLSYHVTEEDWNTALCYGGEKSETTLASDWEDRGWVVGNERCLEQTTQHEFLHAKGIRSISSSLFNNLQRFDDDTMIYDAIQNDDFLVGLGTSLASTVLVHAVLPASLTTRNIVEHPELFNRLIDGLAEVADQITSPLHHQGLLQTNHTGATFAFDTVADSKTRESLAAVRGTFKLSMVRFQFANSLGYFDSEAYLCPDGTTLRRDGSPGQPLLEEEYKTMKRCLSDQIKVELAKLNINGKQVGGLYTPFLVVPRAAFDSPTSYSFSFFHSYPINLQIYPFDSSLGNGSSVPHSIYYLLALVSRGALPADVSLHDEIRKRHGFLPKSEAPILSVNSTTRYLPGKVRDSEDEFIRANRAANTSFLLSIRDRFPPHSLITLPAPVSTSFDSHHLTRSNPIAPIHNSALSYLQLLIPPELTADDSTLPPPDTNVVPNVDLPDTAAHPLFFYYPSSFLPPTVSTYISATSIPHARLDQFKGKFMRDMGRKAISNNPFKTYLKRDVPTGWKREVDNVLEDVKSHEKELQTRRSAEKIKQKGLKPMEMGQRDESRRKRGSGKDDVTHTGSSSLSTPTPTVAILALRTLNVSEADEGAIAASGSKESAAGLITEVLAKRGARRESFTSTARSSHQLQDAEWRPSTIDPDLIQAMCQIDQRGQLDESLRKIDTTKRTTEVSQDEEQPKKRIRTLSPRLSERLTSEHPSLTHSPVPPSSSVEPARRATSPSPFSNEKPLLPKTFSPPAPSPSLAPEAESSTASLPSRQLSEDPFYKRPDVPEAVASSSLLDLSTPPAPQLVFFLKSLDPSLESLAPLLQASGYTTLDSLIELAAIGSETRKRMYREVVLRGGTVDSGLFELLERKLVEASEGDWKD